MHGPFVVAICICSAGQSLTRHEGEDEDEGSIHERMVTLPMVSLIPMIFDFSAAFARSCPSLHEQRLSALFVFVSMNHEKT